MRERDRGRETVAPTHTDRRVTLGAGQGYVRPWRVSSQGGHLAACQPASLGLHFTGIHSDTQFLPSCLLPATGLRSTAERRGGKGVGEEGRGGEAGGRRGEEERKGV